MSDTVERMVPEDFKSKGSKDFFFRHLGMAFISETVLGGVNGGGKTLDRYMISNYGRNEDRVYMDYVDTRGASTTLMINFRALTGIGISDLHLASPNTCQEALGKLSKTLLDSVATVPPMASLLHKVYWNGRGF